MTSRIGAKGQVVIPKAIRDRANLHPGDEVDIELRDEEIVLVARHRPRVLVAGLRTVAWRRACSSIAPASRDERVFGFLGVLGFVHLTARSPRCLAWSACSPRARWSAG